MARALGKVQAPFEFRYTLGAPRGLPGWKELDFLVQKNGMVYPVEVDTEFTHRNKGEADRLHDAIVLSELEQEGYQVFPQVIHVMGESDLIDQRAADATAKRLFQ
jgi:Holliday junction resolvase-like predicted endonuclease